MNPTSPRDPVGIATQYCHDVQAGRIPSCRWVKAATKRQIDDLTLQGTPEFSYRLDPARAGASSAMSSGCGT